MKLSKKVLAAFSAAAVLVASMAVTSCKSSSDDDVNGMISGSNNNYTINYTNSSTETSRGYQATTFKHSGAVVKVTINDPAKNPAGVMGIIFDLAETDGKRSFDIVGLRTLGATDGKIGAYVSRYENITDINAGNFGASTSASGTNPKETEYRKLDAIDATATYDATAKTDTIYVAVILETGTAGNDTNGNSYAATDYVYNVYLTTDAIKISDAGKVTKDADGTDYTFESTAKVATIKTAYTKLEQKQLAVYANVYKNGYKESGWTGTASGTLKGSWQYKGDYKQVTVED